MKLVLKEDFDFTWDGVIVNIHGIKFIVPNVGGNLMKPVDIPAIGSVVDYFNDRTKEIYPVFIEWGNYEVGGRISNFWSWYKIDENGDLTEEEQGQGEFYECHLKFNLIPKIEWK